MSSNDANREHIGRFYDFLNHEPYGVTEVRVIKPATPTTKRGRPKIGHFDNKRDFVDACVQENGNGNIYVGINPRPRRFLDKANNKLMPQFITAKSRDIEWVTAIPIDIDPDRPNKRYMASTQEEMELAIEKAQEVAKYLEEQGLCEPQQITVTMTGNGCHILLAIPAIEVTDENRDKIRDKKQKFEQEIRDRLRNDPVDVDSMYDLPRIIKVIGTMSVRGDNTIDRPHRISYPITDLERHDSDNLRQYILELDISAPTTSPGEPSDRPGPPAQDELPTDLDMDNPCDMCDPAGRLWNAEYVEDRSMATFVMMKVLIAKRVPWNEAIAYIQDYDRRIGGKYTSRPDGGLRDISYIYNKIIRAGGRMTVPCSWLRDNGYCDIGTSECEDKHRSGPRYRPVPVTEEEINRLTISFEEAQLRLGQDISGIRKEAGPRTHLITYPSGVGKTHKVAEHVRIRGWKVLWLCATHEHAQETIRKHFQGTGLKVVHLKGRKYMIEDGELDCPRAYAISMLQNEMPERVSSICSGCYRYRRGCEYYKRYRDARKADVVVAMHAHMQVLDLDKYPEGQDCIVINESFSSNYRKEHSFSVGDVERSISILAGIRDDESVEEEVRDTAGKLIGYHKHFLSKEGSKFTIDPLPHVDDEFMELYNSNSMRYPPWMANVVRILKHISQDEVTITRQDSEYTYVRRAKLPEDVDIIMLDATGDKDRYEAMLGRDVTVYGEDCYIDQVVYVTKFLDGAYPRSSLGRDKPNGSIERTTSYGRVKDLIQAIKDKHKGKNIVIAAVKKVEELLLENGVADDPDDTDTHVEVIHYYDMRGIDHYGYYDVLIVVGHPMLSYEDIAKEAKIVFDQDWDHEEDDEEVVRQMQLDNKVCRKVRYSRDGMGYEVETFQFSNPCIQRYYQHVIVAEVIQMVGRIRPYEGDIKHLYIVNNTPLEGLKVDSLTTIKDFMEGEGRPRRLRRPGSELRAIKATIEEHMPDEFKTVDLLAALPPGPTKRRDRLRKTLREHKEYFGIEFDGHTIKKVRR